MKVRVSTAGREWQGRMGGGARLGKDSIRKSGGVVGGVGEKPDDGGFHASVQPKKRRGGGGKKGGSGGPQRGKVLGVK